MKNLSRILFIITIVAIFYFSSQTGLVSKAQTSEFIKFLGIKYKIWGLNARKWAHVFVYFSLGFFFIFSLSKLTLKKFLLSFIFIIFFAFCDEFYQSFIPRRVSSLKDVKIDFLGGSIGIIFAVSLKISITFLKKIWIKIFQKKI